MKTYLSTNLSLPAGKSLIIFDSNCLLCNRAVLIVLRLERRSQFLVASRNNIAITAFLASNNPLASEDSVILISNNKAYTKSDAIKEITKKLIYWLSPLILLVLITPKSILDKAYNLIAKNRYLLPTNSYCNTKLNHKYKSKTFNP